jgi:hypothetical protein
VFITKKGQPYNRNKIFKEFRALADAAGVPREKLSSDTLRGDFAEHYGADAPETSHALGYMGVSFRLKLVKPDEKKLRGNLDNLFG